MDSMPWVEGELATVHTIIEHPGPDHEVVLVEATAEREDGLASSKVAETHLLGDEAASMANLTMTLTRGLYNLTVSVLPVGQLDATPYDVHRQSIEVLMPLDLPASAYVRAQDGHTTWAVGPEGIDANGTAIVVSPTATEATSIWVYRGWLEAQLGSVTSEQAWQTIVEPDGEWVMVSLPATEDGVEFTRFDVSAGQVFTNGDSEFINLLERPMWFRPLEIRASNQPTGQQANETGPNPPGAVVGVDLWDDSTTGQTLEVNAQWLRELGFESPVFRYEDGERIPASFEGEVFRVYAPHFSAVWIDDADCDCAGELPPGWNLVTPAGPGTIFSVSSEQSLSSPNSMKEKGSEDGTDDAHGWKDLAEPITPEEFWFDAYVGAKRGSDPNRHILELNGPDGFLTQVNVRSLSSTTVEVLSEGVSSQFPIEQWLNIKLTNIDWGACTFTLTVDGSTVGTGLQMDTPCGNGIDTLWMHAKKWDSEAWWVDDIQYLSDTLIDDFESVGYTGDAPPGWTVHEAGNAFRVDDTEAAHGLQSLRAQGGSGSDHAEGVLALEPSDITPSSVAFDAFVHTHQETSSNWHTVEFRAGGAEVLEGRLKSLSGGDVEVSSTGSGGAVTTIPHNTWKTIRFNNIDWSTCRYDLEVGGVVQASDLSFTCSSPLEDVEVRSKGYSSEAWNVDNIRTGVGSASPGVPYLENFDDGVANGWVTSGLWKVDSLCSTPPSTPNYMGYHRSGICDYDTGASTSGTATFDIDLSSITDGVLRWDQRWETESSTSYDKMSVEISTDAGQTWTVLDSWSGADQLQWESASLTLDAHVGGDAKIRYVFDSIDGVNNDFDGWYIDNVEVVEGSIDTSPTACFTVNPTSGNEDEDFNFDGSCSSDPDDATSSLEVRWDWTNDGSWDTSWSTDKTRSHNFASGGSHTVAMQVRDPADQRDKTTEVVDVNSLPHACFSTSENDRTVTVDASCSSDDDGGPLSYSWDWDDGDTDTGGPANSHTYEACPTGNFVIVLTVDDGNGATDQTGRSVTTQELTDSDNDGLLDCEETDFHNTDPNAADTDGDGLTDGDEVNIHNTDPLDTDTDNDEFHDKQEVDRFGKPGIFCGASECAYPDPVVRDLYVEVDGWESCNILGVCTTHMISSSEVTGITDAYAASNVNIHIDDGRFGDGGQIIQNGSVTADWDQLENEYEDNPTYFDPARDGIFHQVIFVDNLDSGGEAVCGVAEGASFDDGRLDFAAVAHGDFDNILSGCASGPADESGAVQDTTMEELGHHDLQDIDPGSDQCSEAIHDKYDEYVIECGSHADIIDFHPNRWLEYKSAVEPEPGTPDHEIDTNHPRFDPDSVGDLNDGFESSISS